MVDSNGIEVKSGDKIITERGSELNIIEKNGELFMINYINGKETSLSVLNINFYIQK